MWGSLLFGPSWNGYSYVHNSPLNATDPTGFTPCITIYGPGQPTLYSDGCFEVPTDPTSWAGLGLAAYQGGGYIPGWGGDVSGGRGPGMQGAAEALAVTGAGGRTEGV